MSALKESQKSFLYFFFLFFFLHFRFCFFFHSLLLTFLTTFCQFLFLYLKILIMLSTNIVFKISFQNPTLRKLFQSLKKETKLFLFNITSHLYMKNILESKSQFQPYVMKSRLFLLQITDKSIQRLCYYQFIQDNYAVVTFQYFSFSLP